LVQNDVEVQLFSKKEKKELKIASSNKLYVLEKDEVASN
jgi:hypothetical protein